MPSVHRAAGSDLNQLAFTAGQLEAIGQQLLQGFLHQVALALLGAASGNLSALRALLNTWAQGLDATVSNLEALLANAAQGTAAEVGAAISTSASNLQSLLNNSEAADYATLGASLKNLNSAGLYDASVGFANQATSILRYLNASGQFNAKQLAGALDTALAVGGQTVGAIQANLAAALHSLLTVSGDPYFGNVVALLHCDGTAGSTTFADSSPLASIWTTSNGSVLSTAQSKFGGASAVFPNSNSVVIAANPTSNYAFGTDDFTIEAWIYVTAYTTNWAIIWDARNGVSGGTIAVSSGGALYYWYNGAGVIGTANGAVTTGAWHHIAVARSNGLTKLFLDGVQAGATYTDANNYSDPGSGIPAIGNYHGFSQPFGPNNYIDEFRITKGIARYTSNFAVPTAAFPSTGVTYGDIGTALNTTLTMGGKTLNNVLVNLNAAGQFDASQLTGAVNTAVTVAGTEIGAVESNASSAVAQLTDAAENAFGGAAAATTAFGQAVAAGFGAIFGAWTGQQASAAAAVSSAGVSESLQAAAQQSAAAQAAQALQTASIQAQLPHFYGGSGTAGTSVQTTFPSDGSLPPEFSAVSTVAHATLGCATPAQTDSQTVSAIWSVTDANPKYLILRANAGFTSYTYAKLYPGFTFVSGGEVPVTNVDICAVVAGVQTTFTTIRLPSPKFGSGAYGAAAVANQTYLFEAVDYTLTITGNGGTGSFTDTSHVSQVGADYRYGGIGTDDTTAPAGENVYSFVFYDSGPTAGPASEAAATAQTTTSTTYTDLATPGPEVTINIGASGMALVVASVADCQNSSSTAESFISVAASGANTIAASDANSALYQAFTANAHGSPVLIRLFTGLSQGATTFKVGYRVSGGTGTFTNRYILAIPF